MESAIEEFLTAWNADPKPFVWTARVEEIIKKIERARAKLEHPAVRAVFVTDTISVTEKDWLQLHVVSIAPLLASALTRFLADDSIGDLC